MTFYPAFVLAAGGLLVVASLQAQGPAADDLLFGMSTALTGPTAALGQDMRTGFQAAFEEANRAGGVAGRHLRLVALDDGYEPRRTAPNMRRLIGVDEVLGVLGNVGTPTAIAAIPIATESKVLFYGAFTGAGVLRTDPPNHYVVNYRASYAEETGAMVDALIEHMHLDVHEVAFFSQRDGYGDSGFAGGIAALRRHGLTAEHRVAHGRYERNTLAIENGLAEILQHAPPPRAVILIGTYAPCAAFIRGATAAGLDAVYLNLSFVGTRMLAQALTDSPATVLVTEVVPHYDADLECVRSYRQALAAFDAKAPPDFGSLEGYVAARILLRALAGRRGPITRESIVDALEGLGRIDIGLGCAIELSPTQHQACHGVWPIALRHGRAEPIAWRDLERPVSAGPGR